MYKRKQNWKSCISFKPKLKKKKFEVSSKIEAPTPDRKR